MDYDRDIVARIGPVEEGECTPWLGCYSSQNLPVLRKNNRYDAVRRIIYEHEHKVKLKHTEQVYMQCEWACCVNVQHMYLKHSGFEVDLQRAVELREQGMVWDAIAREVGWHGLYHNLSRKVKHLIETGKLTTNLKVWK